MFILFYHIVLFPGGQNYISFTLFIFDALKANSNLRAGIVQFLKLEDWSKQIQLEKCR